MPDFSKSILRKLRKDVRDILFVMKENDEGGKSCNYEMFADYSTEKKLNNVSLEAEKSIFELYGKDKESEETKANLKIDEIQKMLKKKLDEIDKKYDDDVRAIKCAVNKIISWKDDPTESSKSSQLKTTLKNCANHKLVPGSTVYGSGTAAIWMGILRDCESYEKYRKSSKKKNKKSTQP